VELDLTRLQCRGYDGGERSSDVSNSICSSWFELTGRGRFRDSLGVAELVVVNQSSNSAESNELVG
jgi:hypothetical protein